MTERMRSLRRDFKVRLARRVAPMALLLIGFSASAHTPQDGIDAMAVSPAYADDSTLAIIVQNYLYLSRNRGEKWKQLTTGLDNLYVLSDTAFSAAFASDRAMYVASDGDGVFRSADGGASWARYNDGLPDRHIGIVESFHTADGDGVVFAAGAESALYSRRPDDPEWRRVASDDLLVMALHGLRRDDEAYFIAGAADGTVLRGRGDGSAWERVGRIDQAGGVTAIALVDTGGTVPLVLAGTADAGLFRSTDLGETFEPLPSPWPARTEDCLGKPLETPVADRNIRSIEVDYDAAGTPEIVANTWYKAILVSDDLGDTWYWRGEHLLCDEQADKPPYRVPHYRNVEIAGGEDDDWFLAAFDGLFRSVDGGRTWRQLETLPVSFVRGLGVSPPVGDGFTFAVTTYGGGAYLTPDLGERWTIANRGLLTTRLADIEFSPDYTNDGLVLVGEKEHLPRLAEDGASWIENDLVYRGFRRWFAVVLRYHAGFPDAVSMDLLLSDFERTQIWPMQLEFSPDFADDETVFIGHRRHGVWRSTDGGEDWDRDWDGELNFVTGLDVSPNYAEDRSVFAAMRGAGIYRTKNGGRRWQLANEGFEFHDWMRQPDPQNYVIDRPLYNALQDPQIVVSPDFANDRMLFASSAQGLFRSTDAGESWSAARLPDGVAGRPVTALGISPDFAEDGFVIANVKGHGLARSLNGGRTFELAGSNLTAENWELKYVAFSPRFASDGIIIGGTDEEVLVSRDRGGTWTRLSRPVRYEDWRGEDRGPVEFFGEWTRELDPRFSGSSQGASEEPGAVARLIFPGPSIAWRAAPGPDGGMARVEIDGEAVATVDLYRPVAAVVEEVYRIDDLSPGTHVIEIEVLDQRNEKSSGNRVTVDAFDTIH